MVFAIEEINNDEALLPNITLGYRLYDNCVNLPVALGGASALINGLEEEFIESDCTGITPVLAIVGDPTSTHSMAISKLLSPFQIPLVSYYATCSCLSNKQEYSSFFRTVPSDNFQVKAIIQIIKHYGWTWVGAIASDDDYGQYAMRNFSEEFKVFGCLSFLETLPKLNEKDKIFQIVNSIKQSSAKVVVIFAPEVELMPLVQEIVHQNITSIQWIASEAWSTSTVLASKENFISFGGTIGVAVRRGLIPGLQNFLLQVQPDFDPDNNLSVQFWEALFDCQFQENKMIQNSTIAPAMKKCTGEEEIISLKTAYSDVSELRVSYNVYKAVYALAHALHNLMSCKNGKGPFEGRTCADIANVQPWQVLEVSFTTHLGEKVAFDENGDAIAIYDIINWQRANDGSVRIADIGIFDQSAEVGKEVSLNEDAIFWNSDTGKAPESVCSKNCESGTRKASKKGQPVCCFDCVPCADGEISNQTDSIICLKCPDDFWSNEEKDQCILKEVEFLSFEDAMGITLTTTALVGAGLSICVLAIFIKYKNTPVVKANNSELSFLLLVSLTFCFFCALTFIGQPSTLTCILRHVVFGISFVLCVSCILVKTVVVIVAFRANMPGNNMMKWFGAAQQRGTIFFFTSVQSMICTIWLSVAAPVPAKNNKYQNSKIILECEVGSVTGFSFLLGYIGLLASACFVLAFFARNLPDTFNEARFITFSMLIFCAVWITFIPAYISSPGKHTVAVEVFAILASSFGLLFSIFAPKCYIILLKPEQNTKKVLMTKGKI
ncbi:extracellular calcium-sensing receptor-like [Erpetoichthys calabaricus]|uniref:extracellular calcium-sensing receptor-like n=1 Tax=Erpetoichthys calabaricus TaxID=27687 RepID=UPI002234E1E2|nr:extracellular calcium-sensing receptor-like [Erpetoichthys calabaricus]